MSLSAREPERLVPLRGSSVVLIVVLPVICFLGFVIAHVAVFHFFPPRRRFRAMLLLMCGACAAYALLFWLTVRGQEAAGVSLRQAEMCVGFFLYFFLCSFFIQLVVLFDRSVSIRIMVELHAGRSRGGLTIAEIKTAYRLEEKFEDEIRDMVFLSRFIQEGEYIMNTPGGSRHARLFGFLRRFLNLATNR